MFHGRARVADGRSGEIQRSRLYGTSLAGLGRMQEHDRRRPQTTDEATDQGASLPGVGKLTVIGGGTAGTGSIGTTSGDLEGTVSGGPGADAIAPGGETRMGSLDAGGHEESGAPGSLGMVPGDESAPTEP
jgi:hypothetical protein